MISLTSAHCTYPRINMRTVYETRARSCKHSCQSDKRVKFAFLVPSGVYTDTYSHAQPSNCGPLYEYEAWARIDRIIFGSVGHRACITSCDVTHCVQFIGICINVIRIIAILHEIVAHRNAKICMMKSAVGACSTPPKPLPFTRNSSSDTVSRRHQYSGWPTACILLHVVELFDWNRTILYV